jgi:hypothetical protein
MAPSFRRDEFYPALLAVGLSMVHPKLAFFDHVGAVVVAIL